MYLLSDSITLIMSLRIQLLALLTILMATATGCFNSNSTTLGSKADPKASVPIPKESVLRVPAPNKLTHIETGLTEARQNEGWIALFDGGTLFGWQPGGVANWKVDNGTILVTEGDVGLLCTTTTFSNYQLHVEFLAEADTNSGIFLHTTLAPSSPTQDCYEINIADPTNDFPTGSLVGRQKVNVTPTVGWQTFDITVNGAEISIALNGQPILDYVDEKPLGRGQIGIQHNHGQIAFRNLHLKPVQLTPIFNGSDLSGWKNYPKMESKFTVTDAGHLHVKNGKGQLETEGKYGNFVMQLECKTHAQNLNSGIFFRCIPGETMNGYESQIHNGFEADDRNQPTDCGTGGIFRRQNARWIAADDLVWFQKTLVADGPHIAVWVNGLQVSDWIDERPAHKNPRKGLRLEPGTIMIQGHDPTTNISFRHLRVSEMAQRSEGH